MLNKGKREIRIDNRIVLDHKRLQRVKVAIPPVNMDGLVADPTKPIFFWYQDTPVGKELFLALYTKKCAWARCTFCALPSVSSPIMVAAEHIIGQARSVLESLSAVQKALVRRFFISNNGSVFDRNTLAAGTLDHICKLGHRYLPNLEFICIETRFETVTRRKLLRLLCRLPEWHALSCQRGWRRATSPVHLQISGGYETQDPFLRNRVLGKGYPEWLVQEFYSLLSEVKTETGFAVYSDENILLKPAIGLNDCEAFREAVETILHLERLGDFFKVPVSVRLNPTFVAAGSYLHGKFRQGEYSPPRLCDVLKVLKECRRLAVRIPIFVGLNEEMLAAPGGSFHRQQAVDHTHFGMLKRFNASQEIRF